MDSAAGPGPEDQIYADDVLLLEQAATAAATKVEDGNDTFVVGDGSIRLQTVRSTLPHTSWTSPKAPQAVVSRLSSQAGGYAGS